jgi:hypothetical protein
LEILKLPPSTTLRIRCTFENTATNNVHLLRLVSAHFHDPASVEIKSFKVASDCAPRLLTLTAFTYLLTLTTHPPSVSEGDLNGGAALALTFHASFEAEADILGQVCSMLPISNIEFLSISARKMDRSINWGELFQRCAKLTTIEVNGHGASGLLKELRPPKPKKAPSGEKGRKRKLDDRGPAPASSSHTTTADTPVPIFPKLTSLFLNDLDFSEPNYHPDAVYVYEVLSTMLRRRRACEVPLRMLRIYNCIVTTNRANALGKLVPEFAWHRDGNESESEGSSLDESDDFADLSDVSTEDGWED